MLKVYEMNAEQRDCVHRLTISFISETTQEILIFFVLTVLNLMGFSWQCVWVMA